MESADITFMLRAVAGGDREHLDRLLSAVYDDMRRLAQVHLSRERGNHTLAPTALVHEAYLKLVNQHATTWMDRLHFFSIASQIIRRILIDYARERNALKRGGAHRALSIDAVDPVAPSSDLDLLDLDEALNELAALSERQARIVEMRFFGGLTIPEVAAALEMGSRSVDREWQAARAWLYRRLSRGDAEPTDGNTR